MGKDGNDVLDDILADKATAEPTSEATTTATTEQPAASPTATGEQPRGPDGKFAPKAGDAAQPAQPASTAQPATAGEPWEKEKAGLLAAIADLRKRVGGERQQPQRTEPPKEQPKPKSFWDNPEAYLKEQLMPVAQSLQLQREGFSRLMAVQSHGREAVQAAYQAMGEGLQAGNRDAAYAYQRIMSSEHPFDELVAWHKQSQNLARVGSDPDKFIASELEKKLADPTFQAEFIKRIQASAAGNTQQGQTPVTLPPSLSTLPGGGNQPTGRDMSEEARFQRAMTG